MSLRDKRMLTTHIDRCLTEEELSNPSQELGEEVKALTQSFQERADRVCNHFMVNPIPIEVNIMPSKIYGEYFADKIIIYTTTKVGGIIMSYPMEEVYDTLIHELAHYIADDITHKEDFKEMYDLIKNFLNNFNPL